MDEEHSLRVSKKSADLLLEGYSGANSLLFSKVTEPGAARFFDWICVSGNFAYELAPEKKMQGSGQVLVKKHISQKHFKDTPLDPWQKNARAQIFWRKFPLNLH